MQQTNTTSLYKHLQTLDMLYRQESLGDCYVDLTQNLHISNTQQVKQQSLDSKFIEQQTTHNQTQGLWQSLEQKVSQCRLCGFDKLVKDSHRSCGIKPTKQNDKALKEIGFIVESLHFIEMQHDKYNTLQSLELNRVNDMLFDIIQKVFLLNKENVFIIPLFKCVEVGDNHNISMNIRTQSLATQRRICGNYLHTQLECVDYAVFFGENICNDFFETTLQESSGKLLDYYTQNGKKVICVCVSDIMQMLMNPKLKKDAFINFVLLKNAMYANSC